MNKYVSGVTLFIALYICYLLFTSLQTRGMTNEVDRYSDRAEIELKISSLHWAFVSLSDGVLSVKTVAHSATDESYARTFCSTTVAQRLPIQRVDILQATTAQLRSSHICLPASVSTLQKPRGAKRSLLSNQSQVSS